MYLNKVILAGKVGGKPQFFNDGKIVRFSLATQSYYKKENEKISKTTWHRVVFFKPSLIEVVKKYVDSGVEVYIEGSNADSTFHDEKSNSDKTVSFVKGNLINILKFKSKTEEQSFEEKVQAEIPMEDEELNFSPSDDLPY